MKRRSFLKSAAAVLPTVGLQSFAIGQTSAPPPPGPIHPVDAGHDRFGETHSLGYSSILFKTVPRETNDGLFIIEHTNMTKGGPPLHLHPHQEEWFYVMEGEVLFQIGDTRKLLHLGDSILGPRGIPHTFSLVGEKPGRMLIAFTPAGKMEQFFREAAVPGQPKLDAEMFRRHDMELVGPPIAVS
jgi:quercetin dioxygenase-like cupin family protein